MLFEGIELAGFKSFADKVEIKLDNGMTAIVGPNGCGKSNFGDAIRWVLGEQSSKSLRGTSMQDVIFGGTEKRKSLSYCEVTLHFNNSSHFFNSVYDELAVTRKLYRNGESEYLINRNNVRLKDIRDLFYDSGLGRDGYSIIGQGKVEQIIQSKPEDRRAIFEEASGIAKFKARKVEAEHKLEKTQENLTRLRDIIFELDKQLGPLKKQAETAKKYIGFKEVLKDLEINAYIYLYDNSGKSKEEIQNKLDGILQEISLRQTEIVGLNQEYNDCLIDISEIDLKIKDINNQILALTVDIEKQAGETRLLSERIQNIRNQNTKLDGDIANYRNIIAKNSAEKSFHEERKAKLNAEAKILEENSGEYASLIKTYSTLKTNETELITKIKQSENSISDLNANIQVSQNRFRLLSEMQKDFEGYAYAVKKLLKDSEKNPYVKSRIVGVLSALITVPEQYETAIDVALGSAMQNIVTANENHAKDLINYLKQNSAGRATFMPITTMKPKVFPAQFYSLLKTKGCFGIASGLIKFDNNINNVVSNLLGSTVIVDNLETANILAKESKNAFKIVTLEGDVVSVSGSMTGGSKKSNSTNLLGREREIKDLENTINNLQVDFKNKKLILNDLSIELEKTQKQIEELDKKKNSAELSEAVKIAEINTEIAGINKDFERIEFQNKEYENLIEKYKKEQEVNLELISKEEEKVNEILKSTQNTDAEFKLEVLKTAQNKHEQDKTVFQEKLSKINTNKEEVQNLINSANEKKYRADLELAQIESNLEKMKEDIFAEYSLTYETCQEYKKENFNYEEARPEIARLNKEIKALGYVNVNAIEDVQVLYERYSTLSEQADDLEKAEADTLQVIDDLATQMAEKFETSFNQINENFKLTFKELFGGGNAHLELVGSDNILEAGVDIVAEPPGKKLQNITLLSGGEKALTSIAILFAILKLKPMPFCLLDEIEAALDDANVDRFAQYLRRFSDDTQFIVITHRKPTMELADSLYGVTMEEKGVSKVVSVKLSDALKNAKGPEELKEENGAV